jgi:flagellar biosynthetic protein FliQ
VDPEEILNLTQYMIGVALKLASPFLLSTMLVGIILSMIQTVFSIQENSFNFIPKIFIIMVLVVWLSPWMGDQLQVAWLKLMFMLKDI